MNELKINVRDFISDEMLQKIAEDECRMAIREFFQFDVERKIANTLYAVVFRVVDAVFEENGHDFRAELIERMKDTIKELPSYYIFRCKDQFEPRNSTAQDILEEESRLARPLIRERVKAAVLRYDFGRLTEDEVQDALYNVIRDRLFGDREEANEDHA